MEKIIIAIVVIIAGLGHWLLYRWVKFKIHEGVILQFLRDASDSGAPNHHHAEAIASHTQLPVQRVAAVCVKSREIHPDPDADNSWRATGGVQ